MISDNSWKASFEAEIQRAEKARAAGNEGMARVCARRAAGVLIGEYLKHQSVRQSVDPGPDSAYDRLRYLSELPGVSPQVTQTVDHLLSRVTQDHNLAVEADLIAEARWLRQELLGE